MKTMKPTDRSAGGDSSARLRVSLIAALVIMPHACALAGEAEGRVTVLASPDGGIQPQAAIDDDGVIHLIYFKGTSAAGDVFYVRQESGGERYSEPIRVNSQPGSAIATGTIRGAQLALGRKGRVHVAWNGSGEARPANPIKGSPMLYARSNDDRTGFEPQRNLMRRTWGLDGGGTVAADAEGHVYVGWHGRTPDAPDGEVGRRFYVARSDDDGATFAEEEPALAEPTGACACCGTRALVDPRGTLYAMFRAAGEGGEQRDMYLLASSDRGKTFRGGPLHPWRVNMCPMSSESLAEGKDGMIAAWETKGQVYFAKVDPKALRATDPISLPGGGDQKHPAVACNAKGETILVWAEGTGWQRGGSLAWQVFDASGRPTQERGRLRGGVPVWGLATVVARPDGGFTIIH
jgi:hypothetical protein